MKLLLAIIQDEDAPLAVGALVAEGFRVTKLASTGGFIKSGNTTLLIGVSEDQTEAVAELLNRTCRMRRQPAPLMSPGEDVFGGLLGMTEVVVGGAVVFQIPVERFERYG